MVSRKLKKTIRRALRRFGVDVIRWTPESSPMAALARLLTHHRIDTVLDVGANEGQYALFLRELGYEGRIISFEPLTVAHQRLTRNADRDLFWSIAPRMALGNQEGQIRVNVASNAGASSSILPMLEAHKRAAPDVEYIGSEVVPISRLDRIAPAFLWRAKNVFLKIDVQGYELQVLQGATHLLQSVAGVQVEFSFLPLYEGQALLPALADCMRKHGLSLWGIIPGFADSTIGRLLQADFIFFRG